MFIKMVSNIMIVICTTLLGMQMSERLSKRLYNIRILRSILVQLETEIVNYSVMLPQAIRNATGKSNSQWDSFFSDFISALESNKEDSLALIWQDILEGLSGHPFIGDEELEIMARFGGQLGLGDKKAQQRYFSLVQEQLKTEEDNVLKLKSKYSRMYRSLGLLLGLVIAIILL